MSVADLSPDVLQKLAIYLDIFSPAPRDGDESDSEQYWYLLAVTLRKKFGDFKYTSHDLAKIGDHDRSAEQFLKLLVKKKLNLEVLITCLKEIKCQKAINMFTRASVPVVKDQTRQALCVAHGGTITLSVVAECSPGSPIYQWFKDQVNPLPEQTKKTLLIHKANVRDTGYYHCRVTNPYINDPEKGCVFTEYIRVDVTPPDVVNTNPTVRQEIGNRRYTPSPPPLITLHPSHVTSPSGSHVRLECRAERAVCYDWYKNGQPFKTGLQDGVLVFETLKSDDCGEYYCVVANDEGRVQSDTVRVTLDLSQPQESQQLQRDNGAIAFEEQPPEVVDVRVGEELILTCRATSKTGEPVVYQWFQKLPGKSPTLKGTESVYKAKTNEINRKLTLHMYCQVSLAGGCETSAKSRTVKVTVNTVWFTKQPLSIKRGFIGEKATLSCSAEGVGNIGYLWLKSATKNGKFRPINRGKPHQSGVWYFNRLKQDDWGYYFCQAQNESEFITSDTVCVRPTIPSMKRTNSFKMPLIRIVKNPWSQLVKENGKFRLLCEAVCTGDEQLQYQWYYCCSMIHGATEPEYKRDPAGEGDCGPYYCEVKCTNNQTVTPVFSKTARIELAPEERPSPVIVGKNGRQLNQMEAEQVYTTKKDERYAREKVALLIGNQHYQCDELNDLLSPENDIRHLCGLLEDELNFKVISLLNLTHEEMMRALERFYEMLAVSGIYALFYYSGHGFSTSTGKNYLIPVDANSSLRCDQNIHVDMICGQMRKKLSRAVVVLDCCRVQSRTHESIPSSLSDGETSLPLETEENPNSANYFQITSCQDNNPAYDVQSTELSPVSTPSSQSRQLASCDVRHPCSYFNVAFRESLKEKKNLYEIFQYCLDRACENEELQGMAAGQRPTHSGSLRDNKITLHDDVFMDNNENEPKLNHILKLYQEAHYVPENVLMETSDEIGELSGLTQLELSFSYDFSNVLCVHTRLHLLHSDKTSQANIEYDIHFLEGQGVTGEQTECTLNTPVADPDVRGQGENPSCFISTTIKISSIQRLRSDAGVLKLLLTLSLKSEGEDRKAKVKYEFPKKPLFANLQSQ